MKKIVVTSALLLCTVIGFSQQAPASKPPTAEQMAQREANALSQRLSLTEDQRSKAYSVFLDKTKKDMANREARMKEMQKQRDQATADTKQQRDKISQLLNADQKKTFQDMQTRLNNRASRPGGPRGKGPGFQQRNFQREPWGQSQRHGNHNFRFRSGRGGQFQGPGNQRFRSQPGQGGQFQRRNMPQRFQERSEGQRGFQQVRPDSQNFREQFRERSQTPEFQNRMNRFRQTPGATQTAPDNSQPKPADNSK